MLRIATLALAVAAPAVLAAPIPPGLDATRPAGAAPADGAAAPARGGAEDAGEELPVLADIMKQITELRGLEFKKKVPGHRQSMEDWSAFLSEELDKMFPPDKRRGVLQGLTRLGFFEDEPIDLGEELQSALVSQAAGYYDPATDTFYYLMDDMPEEFLRTVAAHELVHALQDQHFDLMKLSEPLEKPMGDASAGPRNDDRVQAFRCLVEGEATYVQMIWQTREMTAQMGADMAQLEAMGMDVDQMTAMGLRMMGEMSLEEMTETFAGMQGEMMQMGGDAMNDQLKEQMAAMDDIPPYILEPLVGAYMKGAVFTLDVREAGGWEAVDAAYRDLPASTEQVLHPEKYTVNRDEPTPVVLPASLLEMLTGRGWTPIDAATHGEMYLELLLRHNGVPRRDSLRASAGWDGDVYHAFRDDQDRVLVILATTWDREKDAREFYDAYRQVLRKKYPARETRDEAEDAWRYDTMDAKLGRGAIVRRGREVFSVEGGSGRLVDRIVEALEKMEIDRR